LKESRPGPLNDRGMLLRAETEGVEPPTRCRAAGFKPVSFQLWVVSLVRAEGFEPPATAV
jgi:hypothetical protein